MMKRIYLLACCAVMSGCLHTTPVEVKKEVAAPAATEVKPQLSVALLEKTIVKGKTPKEELLAKLGIPNSVQKHPYHVPKITTPGFKMDVPPEMMAVETWNYWTITEYSADKMPKTALGVEIYIDETGVALDYKAIEKDVSKPPGL